MSLFFASSSFNLLPSSTTGPSTVPGSETWTTWDVSNTWNNASSDPTYSDINQVVGFPNGTFPNNGGQARSITAFNSGLRYVEVRLISRQSASLSPSFGLISAAATTSTSVVASDIFYWWGGGTPSVWVNGSGTNYGSAWSIGDVLGMLVDMNAGTVTFYRNGVSQGVAISNLPAGSYHIFARTAGSSINSVATFSANFGATPFAFPVAGATGIQSNNALSWIARPGVAHIGGGTMTLAAGIGAGTALLPLPSTGNWYFELQQTSGIHPLICLGTPAPAGSGYPGSYARSGGYYLTLGNVVVMGGTVNTSGTNIAGSTDESNPIGVAYTASTRTAVFYRKGVMVGSLSIGGTETLYPSVGNGGSASPLGTFVLNIGGSAFTNPIPPGFTALMMRP